MYQKSQRDLSSEINFNDVLADNSISAFSSFAESKELETTCVAKGLVRRWLGSFIFPHQHPDLSHFLCLVPAGCSPPTPRLCTKVRLMTERRGVGAGLSFFYKMGERLLSQRRWERESTWQRLRVLRRSVLVQKLISLQLNVPRDSWQFFTYAHWYSRPSLT